MWFSKPGDTGITRWDSWHAKFISINYRTWQKKNIFQNCIQNIHSKLKLSFLFFFKLAAS